MAIVKVPHQSLERSEDKLWLNTITVPLDSKLVATLPALSRPQPDSIFGYCGGVRRKPRPGRRPARGEAEIAEWRAIGWLGFDTNYDEDDSLV